MGAKVGRKELCQRWRSLGFLMSGEIFELGDRDESGVEG